MFDKDCDACVSMVGSEMGIEEPHEAHAFGICPECGSDETTDGGGGAEAEHSICTVCGHKWGG